MKALSVFALCAICVVSAMGQNLYSNHSADPDVPALNARTTTKSGVTSPAGGFWSEVQNDAGNTTESNTSAGQNGSSEVGTPPEGFFLADDFVVTGGPWTITGLRVYGYRTGFGTAVPVDFGRMQIWDGRPGDAGSNILYDTGANYTNIAVTDVIQATPTQTGNIFRIFNTTTPPPGTAPGTTRRVWQSTFTIPAQTLNNGTYWVAWQVRPVGGTAAAVFMPGVTIEGSRAAPGANGRQRTNLMVWQDNLDGGNPATAPDVILDMPFILVGTAAPAAASGTVTLQNLIPDEAGFQATIQVRNVGSTTALQTANVTLGAGGSYSFNLNGSITPGTYDFRAKSSHWLGQLAGSVTVTSTGATNVNFSLINGDVNGNNEVDLPDYVALANAFGSIDGDPNWNPNADLNGDGEVALGDYNILGTNFGQIGDD